MASGSSGKAVEISRSGTPWKRNLNNQEMLLRLSTLMIPEEAEKCERGLANYVQGSREADKKHEKPWTMS